MCFALRRNAYAIRLQLGLLRLRVSFPSYAGICAHVWSGLHKLILSLGSCRTPSLPPALFGERMLFYSHTECSEGLGHGRLPEFMDGPFFELRFVLVAEGLGSLSDAWPSRLPDGRFQSCLTRACLAADFLRFFLRLLTCGTPSYLVAPGTPEICTGAVSGVPSICTTVHSGRVVLHRQGEDCSHLFHLFPN